MNALTTSSVGLNLIKSFESFKSNPYLPTPNDKPTIGYGTTLYPNGIPVKLGDPSITEDQATEYLSAVLKPLEKQINKSVTIDLAQNQFDALISFAYNVGIGNFLNSTLLKKLNSDFVESAADQFLVWDKQAGNVLAGLLRRREAERALFIQ